MWKGVSFDTSIAKKSPEVRELPIDPKTAKGPEKPEFIIHRADPEPADYGKEDMTNEPEKKTPESENDPKTQKNLQDVRAQRWGRQEWQMK